MQVKLPFTAIGLFNQNIKYSRDSNNENMAYPGRDEGDNVEYIMLSATKPVEADQAPLVTPITDIFVYTDFIEYVMVVNSQTPLLGYLPVQSTWGNVAYWNFIRVKEQNIWSPSLKLCNKLGDAINFESDNVICRLQFRRIR